MYDVHCCCCSCYSCIRCHSGTLGPGTSSPRRLKTCPGTSPRPLEVRFSDPEALACLSNCCREAGAESLVVTSKAEERLPLPLFADRIACTMLGLSRPPLPPLPADDTPPLPLPLILPDDSDDPPLPPLAPPLRDDNEDISSRSMITLCKLLPSLLNDMYPLSCSPASPLEG